MKIIPSVGVGVGLLKMPGGKVIIIGGKKMPPLFVLVGEAGIEETEIEVSVAVGKTGVGGAATIASVVGTQLAVVILPAIQP